MCTRRPLKFSKLRTKYDDESKPATNLNHMFPQPKYTQNLNILKNTSMQVVLIKRFTSHNLNYNLYKCDQPYGLHVGFSLVEDYNTLP